MNLYTICDIDGVTVGPVTINMVSVAASLFGSPSSSAASYTPVLPDGWDVLLGKNACPVCLAKIKEFIAGLLVTTKTPSIGP